MNDDVKVFVDERLKKIYNSLSANWQKGFRINIEKISAKGLSDSGMFQNILTNYAIKLVSDVNEEVKNILNECQEKFDFIMSSENIEEYINRSINNSNYHLELMQSDLIDYFDKKKIPLVESCKLQLRNAKINNKSTLEEIKKEMILVNKNKNNKMKDKLNKNDIINYGLTILGIIVSIVLAIIFA